MNCQKCGMNNDANAKFCIKCGNSLSAIETQSLQQVPVETETLSQNSGVVQNTNSFVNQDVSNSMTQNVGDPMIQNMNGFENTNVNVPQQNQTLVANVSDTPKISLSQYFFIILAVMLKPFTALEQELKKFNNFKNSAIMTLLVSGVATVIKLISSIISAVVVRDYDWTSSSYKTTLVWDNLKNLDYLQLIGKSFLIYVCVIVLIATVYYISSLVAKRQTVFSRLLSVSALSIVPVVASVLVLSPILSLIWSQLAIIITFVGFIYTIVLLYEGMNNEVLLSGNAKYYFNLVCFSVLGFALYYLSVKLLMGSAASALKFFS